MIDLSRLAGAHGAVWDWLIRLAKDRPEGWTLIGAQMVIALGLEHERSYRGLRPTRTFSRMSACSPRV